MIAIVCTFLTAIGFYFSIGLGDQWWVAWFAPIPVLWLAFSETKPWTTFFSAFLGYALGALNILPAYAGAMPFVVVLAICGPASLFAGSVVGARRVYHALGMIPAMFGFAALWTTFDFLSSFSRAGGSASTPAAAEVGVPILIQSAAVVGYLGVTFLLGAVSAGLALSLRTREIRPLVIAVALFVVNAVFGYWHASVPPRGTMKIALVESDRTVGAIRKEDKAATMSAIDAYVQEITKLRDADVALIVLPENISRVSPAWREEAQAKLAGAATQARTTLVAGFNTYLDGAQRNVSWSFTPDVATPVTYEKRRLVPGVESAVFTPGPGPRVLPNGVGLEVCKDMDFQAMIRADEIATRPILLAVPAWDFDKDDWSHARVAIFRSVENGVPMARTARDGLLTLNDRYGRVLARARSGGSFTVLLGDLPLDGCGGGTLYDKLGDLFGWVCLVLSVALLALSFARTPKQKKD
jgi:apolipoprotein N-acyltransferase